MIALKTIDGYMYIGEKISDHDGQVILKNVQYMDGDTLKDFSNLFGAKKDLIKTDKVKFIWSNIIWWQEL